MCEQSTNPTAAADHKASGCCCGSSAKARVAEVTSPAVSDNLDGLAIQTSVPKAKGCCGGR